MSAYTPGPWNYCWSATSQVFMVKSAGFGGLVVADTREKENARLIAAAPELLEALKLALEARDDDKSWEDGALAAIAKATGESP